MFEPRSIHHCLHNHLCWHEFLPDEAALSKLLEVAAKSKSWKIFDLLQEKGARELAPLSRRTS